MATIMHAATFVGVFLLSALVGVGLVGTDPGGNSDCAIDEGVWGTLRGWGLTSLAEWGGGRPAIDLNPPSTWGQLRLIYRTDVDSLCQTDDRRWWSYFKKKRVNCRGGLVKLFCRLRQTVAEPWKWTMFRGPDTGDPVTQDTGHYIAETLTSLGVKLPSLDWNWTCIGQLITGNTLQDLRRAVEGHASRAAAVARNGARLLWEKLKALWDYICSVVSDGCGTLQINTAVLVNNTDLYLPRLMEQTTALRGVYSAAAMTLKAALWDGVTGFNNFLSYTLWPNIAWMKMALLYYFMTVGYYFIFVMSVIFSSVALFTKLVIAYLLELGIYAESGIECAWAIAVGIHWAEVASGIMLLNTASYFAKKVLMVLQVKGWIKRADTDIPMSKTLAKLIGEKYVALKSIGASANFHTLKLYSKANLEIVFIKCLRADACRESKIRLAREFRVLRTLQHPNVVRVLDCLRAGSLWSVVLEFARHNTLLAALGQHTKLVGLTLAEKMSVLRQVVQAVGYLHTSRYAHLNVRAETVLVFRKWSIVKLSAFGRCMRLRGNELCHQFDLHPESAPASVTVSHEPFNPVTADVWALGVLLIYIMTGETMEPLGPSPVSSLLVAFTDCNLKFQTAMVGLVGQLLRADSDNRPDPEYVLNTLANAERLRTMELPKATTRKFTRRASDHN